MAFQELGWSPSISLDEGLQQTIEYFKDLCLVENSQRYSRNSPTLAEWNSLLFLLMRELISLVYDISLLSLAKMGLLRKDLEESNIKSAGFPYKDRRSFRPFELQKLHIFREGGCYNANWP